MPLILLTAREGGLWAESAAGRNKNEALWSPTHRSGDRRQRVFAPLSEHHWRPVSAPKMTPFYRAAKICEAQKLLAGALEIQKKRAGFRASRHLEFHEQFGEHLLPTKQVRSG